MSTEAAVAEPITQEQPQVDTQPEAKAKKKSPSIRDAVKSASVEVADRESKGITETESAARVLRGESEYPEDKPEEKTQTKTETKAKKEPEKKAKAEKPAKEDEPEASKQGGPERDESGRFKSKADKQDAPAEPNENADAPSEQSEATKAVISRFSKQAQADWEQAPESVRNETTRAITELQQGFEKHRERANKFAEIEPYEAVGQRYNMTIKQVLDDYAGMSQLMAQNPLQVFQRLAERHGFQFNEIASKALNVELEDFAVNANEKINKLQARIRELEQLPKIYEEQRKLEAVVGDFRKDHPRLQELAPTIRWIMQTNGVDKSDPQQALIDAYAMAERLKPAAEAAPQEQVQETAPAQPDLSAQTALAEKSVTGSPAPGSNPVNRKPAASARDAVRAAARRTGIA